MVGVNKLVNGRCEPGIVILNLKKQITFANQSAWNLFNVESGAEDPSNFRNLKLPGTISRIFTGLQHKINRLARNNGSDADFLKKIVSIRGRFVLIRAFIVSDQKRHSPTHFLILMDKVAIRSSIGLRHACSRYHLSPREFGVVELLAGGLTNKEIANELHIAECTVKEYMKKIMSKVRANTRAGVVAQVFSRSDRDLRNGGSNGDKSPLNLGLAYPKTRDRELTSAAPDG